MRTPGRLTALYALLVKEFHLTLDQIYNLTPRQIQCFYLHPRDSEGALKVPTPGPVKRTEPVTDRERLAVYHKMREMVRAGRAKPSAEKVAELDRRIADLEGRVNGQPS